MISITVPYTARNHHYIARCASMLAWCYVAGHRTAQLVIDLFVKHQRFTVCCPFFDLLNSNYHTVAFGKAVC